MFQSLIFETRTVSYYKKIIDQYKEFNRIKNRVLKTREKEKIRTILRSLGDTPKASNL